MSRISPLAVDRPFPFVINSNHRPFLVAQRGAIADLASDAAAWQDAYVRGVMADYQAMVPFLPPGARSVLDIGAGLGGIDVLLTYHYRGDLHVALLDGLADKPVMEWHNKPFGNLAVACDFLEENAVENFSYIPADGPYPDAKRDLIISLQAWCFHFNPESYLDFVLASCTPETVLILDVRKDYKTWRHVLDGRFREIGCALEGVKFNRLVFNVR